MSTTSRWPSFWCFQLLLRVRIRTSTSSVSSENTEGKRYKVKTKKNYKKRNNGRKKERMRDKNEQNRKQWKQATKGMKVWHENERKCMEGKTEARNVGNDTKEWEKGNSVGKNTEEEEMRRNEYLYMPCQARPGHSPHSQSVPIAGRPITVFHDATLCALARCSSHITLCAMLRCSSHMYFRPMTDHSILSAGVALSEIRHNVCGISASTPSGTVRFP
jgi:hypothetical protein